MIKNIKSLNPKPASIFDHQPDISVVPDIIIKQNKDRRDKLLNHLTKDIMFDINSPGNHVCWWNYNKLKQYLSEAGFSVIYRSGYGQSRLWWMRDLRYFDQTYPQISVYVEAIK